MAHTPKDKARSKPGTVPALTDDEWVGLSQLEKFIRTAHEVGADEDSGERLDEVLRAVGRARQRLKAK
jgi:hypothetical protein